MVPTCDDRGPRDECPANTKHTFLVSVPKCSWNPSCTPLGSHFPPNFTQVGTKMGVLEASWKVLAWILKRSWEVRFRIEFGSQVGCHLASKSDLSWLSWLSHLILSCLTRHNIGRQIPRSGVAGFGAKATSTHLAFLRVAPSR